MSNSIFFRNFDHNRSIIQNLATQMTKDFDLSRVLYLETIHQAMKNNKNLDQNLFEEWLPRTMNNIYQKLSLRKSLRLLKTGS